MRDSGNTSLWLALVLFLGLVVRLLYLFESVDRPDFASPAVDAAFHDYWAFGLVTGQWDPVGLESNPEIYAHSYLRPPGYPHFLAVVYAVFGPDYLWPRLFQALIGLANGLLVYLIARRFCTTPFALLSGLMMCTYWGFVYYESELLEPVPLVFAILCGLYCLVLWHEKGRVSTALLSGMFLGAAAITRPNVLAFVVVLPVWLVLESRRAGRRALRHVMAVLAGVILFVAPVTVRNYMVAGEFVPVSSNMGINLYLGNSSTADGTFSVPPGIGRFASCFDYPRIVTQVERITGHDMTYSEVSRYFSVKAAQYAVKHPSRTALLVLRKAYLFWAPVDLPHNKVEELERRHSAVLRLLPFSFPVILSLCVLGLAFLFVGRPRGGERSPSGSRPLPGLSMLLLLFAGAYFASFLPFFVVGQYRIAVVPVLIVFACVGVERFVEMVRRRQTRYTILTLVLWLVCYLLVSIDLSGIPVDAARWHFDRGNAYDRLGEREKAVEEYRLALESNPRHEKARLNMANIMLEEGKTEEAIAEYRKIVKRNPKAAGAYNNLGRALAIANRPREAFGAFGRALEIAPDEPVFLRNMTEFLMSPAGRELDGFQKALIDHPPSPKAAEGTRNTRNTRKIEKR